jgi:hypothetical protein
MSTSLLPVLMAPILQLMALPAPTTPPADDADAPSIVHVHPSGCNDDDPDPDRARALIIKLPNGTFETAAAEHP